MNTLTPKDHATALDYPLKRSYVGSARLHLQHFLMRKALGFLLPPNVPVPPNARIADVAAGTGTWLLELQEELPESCVLEGWDISNEQFPGRDLLPANVKFGTFDASKVGGVPADLKGKYDIVHLSLLVCVVKGGDPGNFVRNAIDMLKPGGYLVWMEGDLSGHLRRVENDPVDETRFPSLRELQKLNVSQVTWDSEDFSWVNKLDEHFRAHGLEDVWIKVYELRKQYLRAWTELGMMVTEEYGGMSGKQALVELAQKAGQEIQQGGIYPTPSPILTVGRKKE